MADTLSRLRLLDSPMFKDKTHQEAFYQYQIAHALEDLPEEVMPADFGIIRTHQLNDKSLTNQLKNDKSFITQTFHGAGKYFELTCKLSKNNNGIVIPKTLKQRILD